MSFDLRYAVFKVLFYNNPLSRDITNEIRQPPALPYRLQHSTIGRLCLYHRVRNGNGCCPQAHRHRKFFLVAASDFRPLWQLNDTIQLLLVLLERR